MEDFIGKREKEKKSWIFRAFILKTITVFVNKRSQNFTYIFTIFFYLICKILAGRHVENEFSCFISRFFFFFKEILCTDIC